MGRHRQNIPVDELTPIRDLVTNKTKFSGGEMGRIFGVSSSSVWQWFSKQGITPGVAFQIADVMTTWATELLDGATYLRQVGLKYAQIYAQLEKEGDIRPEDNEADNNLRRVAISARG